MENTNNFNGTIYAISDIGKKRKNNEDAAYCAKSQYGIFLIVCDGMGGHRKGEVASKMVVDSLSVPFCEARHVFTVFRGKHFLAHHSKKVNKEIYHRAVTNDDYREMGTTESAVLVCQDGTCVFSVGDSRVYSFSKKDGLVQISKDQSYVGMLFESGRIAKADMKNHPQRNLLTNAVGLNANLSNYEEFVIDNDYYDSLLLCTDGLYNMISEDDMRQVLSDTSLDTEAKSKELVKRALDAGGNDNVAVIILEK